MLSAAAPGIPVIPDSAPFTPAQRAWLNGFFAGLMSRGSAAPSASDAPAAPAADAAEEDAMPWHDPALAMEERLKLAEGKPIGRQLMAAMAQLDCGACGYECKTYAEAIAAGEEKDLTRCAPGGRDTAKKLKELVATVPAGDVTVRGAPQQQQSPPAPAAAPTATPRGHDRRHPYAARLLRNQPLNSPESDKDTRHIVFDLHGSGLKYNAGDALGVLPENCPDLVGWILEALDASGAESVAVPNGGPTTTLHDALLRHLTITQPANSLIQLLAECVGDPAHAAELKQMLAEDGPGIPQGHEVLDLLKRYPSAVPAPDAFVAALKPLRPRLYSISSSPRAHGDEVHLTVAVVRYVNGLNRQCKGVASTYLAERLRAGQKANVFVHASHGFAPPADANVPMIMVGPGTGVAPFRAFLQDRAGAGARGRNWLFFGDQRRDHDFLYRAELERYLLDGVLTRLDTAFSRDQADKIYVQHRMLERAREIWAWLQDGAHFYVCGDAKRMARDVDAALKQIVAEQGGMTPEAAAAYVSDMSRSKRYARDVY
jgi:sulfite reductase (NADPH) flavoprotein alpha-component